MTSGYHPGVKIHRARGVKIQRAPTSDLETVSVNMAIRVLRCVAFICLWYRKMEPRQAAFFIRIASARLDRALDREYRW